MLALRALVGGDAIARPTVAPTTAPATTSRGAWARWIPLAAGIALIGGITGYVAGSRAISAPLSSQTTVASPAPPPTQVIQLRTGVDWTDHAGGN